MDRLASGAVEQALGMGTIMLWRILLMLAAICAGACIASGQPAEDLPGPCRLKVGEDLAALEKRRESLERRIALARAAKRATEEEVGATKLGKSQAALLDVLFQIQCHKLRQQTASAEARPAESAVPAAPKRRAAVPVPDADAPQAAAPAQPPPPTQRAVRRAVAAASNVIEVTTYFATSPGRPGKNAPASLYDAVVSPPSYGRALITIPGTHTPGSLVLPSIWKIQFQPDPARHFTLKAVEPLGPDEARAEMAKRLAETS